MITDEDGNVVREKKYEAFGNLIWSEGTHEDKREFTSKEKDPTGFHYFGARYYSGDIGRFLSPDPHTLMPGGIELTDPQSINPYVYCKNDPLTLVDPNGLYRMQAERYVYPASVGVVLGENAMTLPPVYGGIAGLAFLGFREATGDKTVTWGDWAVAGASLALGAGGKLAQGGKLGLALKVGSKVSTVGDWLHAIWKMGCAEVIRDAVIWGIMQKEGLVSNMREAVDIGPPKKPNVVGQKFNDIEEFQRKLEEAGWEFSGEQLENLSDQERQWYDWYQEYHRDWYSEYGVGGP